MTTIRVVIFFELCLGEVYFLVERSKVVASRVCELWILHCRHSGESSQTERRKHRIGTAGYDPVQGIRCAEGPLQNGARRDG